jgi:hypothetical protein
VVAAAGHSVNTPQGARHRCPPRLWWWLLPDIPPAPPRGPAIDVFLNFGGGGARDTDSTPRGATIDDLLNFGGGCYWTLVVAAARHSGGTPQGGAAIDVWLNLVPAASIFLTTPTMGPLRYHYKQGKFHGKMKTSFVEKYFWVLAVPKTRES